MDPHASPDPSPVPPTTPPPAYLGLRRTDQLFVGVLLLAGLMLLVVYTIRLSGWGQLPIEIDRLPARRYDYQLDVNRATWIEWTVLDGIGETLAKRIVADREERGAFAKIEDVQRVRGIGPKTWDQIRAYLTISQLDHAAKP